jgi:hypothetical protein
VNTSTHAVVNLAILGRRAHPEWNRPIVFGAILPDAPIVALWLVATLVWREPQRQIWSETYFRAGWQIAVDLLHSFPLLLLALAGLAALRLRPRRCFSRACCSMRAATCSCTGPTRTGTSFRSATTVS